MGSSPTTNPSTPRYRTLREAEALGYASYSTLHRWTREGRLPSVKIGGRVKVCDADLEALVKPKVIRGGMSLVQSFPADSLAATPDEVDKAARRLRPLMGAAA